MKKIFFHNEAIIKRGHPIINFFIVTKGKANVLNSNGSTILKNICSGEVFGIVDNLKEKNGKIPWFLKIKVKCLLYQKKL